MGFLDSIKDSISSVIGNKGEGASKGSGTSSPPKKGGFLGGLMTPKNKADNSEGYQSMTEDDELASLLNGSSTGTTQDEDYDMVNGEINEHRHDVLDLLNIAEDYPVPDNVLLVGDLDSVRFDISMPSGYDPKMVDDFYNSVYDSINWYVKTLQQRNNDIRTMEDMLNKQATDIHNAQVAQAMSDPDFTVVTGAESTSEQQLQEAQLRIMRLQDENDKLKQALQEQGGQVDTAQNSKYEELQNQLALSQMEVKKLTAQLNRSNLRSSEAVEGSLDLVEQSVAQQEDRNQAMPDGSGGMPLGDDGSMGDSMPMGMSGVEASEPIRTHVPRGGRGGERRIAPADMQAAESADDMFDIDMGVHGLHQDNTPSFNDYAYSDDSDYDDPSPSLEPSSNGAWDDGSSVRGGSRATADAVDEMPVGGNDDSMPGMATGNPFDDATPVSPFERRARSRNQRRTVEQHDSPSNVDYGRSMDQSSGDDGYDGLDLPLPDSIDNGDFDELDLGDDDGGTIDMSDFLSGD